MANPPATIAPFNDRTIAALFGPVRKDLDMEALGRRLAVRKRDRLAVIMVDGVWTPDTQPHR